MKWELELTEKEFQDLVFIWLLRKKSETQVHIFREIYINGSNADICVFSPYQKGRLSVYECKMWYDNDRKRLDRQIKDYSEVADYVHIVVFAKILDNLPDNVNQIKVGLKNGVLTYDIVGKDWSRENPRENIILPKKIKTIKSLNEIWEKKLHYGRKIEGVLTRRLERLIKKKFKEKIICPACNLKLKECFQKFGNKHKKFH